MLIHAYIRDIHMCMCTWSLIWNRICYACRICILCKMHPATLTHPHHLVQMHTSSSAERSSLQLPIPTHSTSEPTRPIQIFVRLSSDWNSLPVNIAQFHAHCGPKFIIHAYTCIDAYLHIICMYIYLYIGLCIENSFVTLAFRSFVRSFTSPWKGGQ